MPDLEELDRLIDSPLAVNSILSLDDIRVLPLLRSAAVVKGLRFPKKVRDYFEAMMNHIGYAPFQLYEEHRHETHACPRSRRGQKPLGRMHGRLRHVRNRCSQLQRQGAWS